MAWRLTAVDASSSCSFQPWSITGRPLRRNRSEGCRARHQPSSSGCADRRSRSNAVGAEEPARTCQSRSTTLTPAPTRKGRRQQAEGPAWGGGGAGPALTRPWRRSLSHPLIAPHARARLGPERGAGARDHVLSEVPVKASTDVERSSDPQAVVVDDDRCGGGSAWTGVAGSGMPISPNPRRAAGNTRCRARNRRVHSSRDRVAAPRTGTRRRRERRHRGRSAPEAVRKRFAQATGDSSPGPSPQPWFSYRVSAVRPPTAGHRVNRQSAPWMGDIGRRARPVAVDLIAHLPHCYRGAQPSDEGGCPRGDLRCRQAPQIAGVDELAEHRPNGRQSTNRPHVGAGIGRTTRVDIEDHAHPRSPRKRAQTVEHRGEPPKIIDRHTDDARAHRRPRRVGDRPTRSAGQHKARQHGEADGAGQGDHLDSIGPQQKNMRSLAPRQPEAHRRPAPSARPRPARASHPRLRAAGRHLAETRDRDGNPQRCDDERGSRSLGEAAGHEIANLGHLGAVDGRAIRRERAAPPVSTKRGRHAVTLVAALSKEDAGGLGMLARVRMRVCALRWCTRRADAAGDYPSLCDRRRAWRR